MSAPVLLAIALNMQTALQAIATAAGYFNDVKATSVLLDPPGNPAGFSPTEVPLIIIGHQVEPIERKFETTKPVAIRDRWKYLLEAIVDAPGTDPTRKLTARANFDADVEKALFVDPQRGGLALYTYVGQSTAWIDMANQNRLYIQTPVEVWLGRNYGAP